MDKQLQEVELQMLVKSQGELQRELAQVSVGLRCCAYLLLQVMTGVVAACGMHVAGWDHGWFALEGGITMCVVQQLESMLGLEVFLSDVWRLLPLGV